MFILIFIFIEYKCLLLITSVNMYRFHFLVSLQVDFDKVKQQQNADVTGLTVAHGTPVCRGKYKGVARVITRLADAPTIKQVCSLTFI